MSLEEVILLSIDDNNASFQALERASVEVFGRPIAIAPRAAAAFIEAGTVYQLFGSPVLLASDFDCVKHVISHSPACANALTQAGIDLLRLGQLRPSQTPKVQIRNLRRLLTGIFSSRWPFPAGLTPSGEQVRRAGAMTDVDVFIGALEGSLEGLLTNETGRKLAAAAGFGEDSLIDAAAASLLDTLAQAARRIEAVDESHGAQQFLVFRDDSGLIRVRPFGATSLDRLDSANLPAGPFIVRGNLLEPVTQRTLYSEEAISELELLINSSAAAESDFQRLFERWPTLLTGFDYAKAHPQPVLHRDEGGTLIPDFFLEKVEGGWDAIVELKKPYDEMVVRRPNRIYFRQWVQEAIAQLNYYAEWFDSGANRTRFRDVCNLGTEVFRPRMIIVAGRKRHFLDDVERMRLVSNQGADLAIWTYDDLLGRAKRYREWLAA